MSARSRIEWTETTWNPTTGCDRISTGCDHCYALTLAKRLNAMGSAKYQNDGDPRTSGPGFGVTAHPDTLTAPLRWRDPRLVFVNSMSDLFHARVPTEFVARVFAVMAATPQHTYQVLTERSTRLRPLAEQLPWHRGTLAPGETGMSMVGSRNASPRGLSVARSIAAGLIDRGITVVSGLAKGIDTAAHTAALGAAGRMVAVIGTGITRHYPAENRALQDRIAAEGLVLRGRLADLVLPLAYVRGWLSPRHQSEHHVRQYKNPIRPSSDCLRDLKLMMLAATWLHGECIARTVGWWQVVTFVPSANWPGVGPPGGRAGAPGRAVRPERAADSARARAGHPGGTAPVAAARPVRGPARVRVHGCRPPCARRGTTRGCRAGRRSQQRSR